jgi:hypothetical protein
MVQMPLSLALSPHGGVREESWDAPRPACGEREGPAKREGDGRITARSDGIASGLLQHQRQTGGDKDDAVGECGDLLIEAAGGVAKPPAQRCLGD